MLRRYLTAVRPCGARSAARRARAAAAGPWARRGPPCSRRDCAPAWRRAPRAAARRAARGAAARARRPQAVPARSCRGRHQRLADHDTPDVRALGAGRCTSPDRARRTRVGARGRGAPGTYEPASSTCRLGDAAARGGVQRAAGPYQRAGRAVAEAEGGREAVGGRLPGHPGLPGEARRSEPATGSAGPVDLGPHASCVLGLKNPETRAEEVPGAGVPRRLVDLTGRRPGCRSGAEGRCTGPVPHAQRPGRVPRPASRLAHGSTGGTRHHWSTLVQLAPCRTPSSSSGGQAFHAVYGSIYTIGGSMGLRESAARRRAQGSGACSRRATSVYVWGRRPRGWRSRRGAAAGTASRHVASETLGARMT